MPLATLLASENDDLRARHLRGLRRQHACRASPSRTCAGPGRPAVTATRVDGGWRFDGAVDWTTGWGLVDVFLLGGLRPTTGRRCSRCCRRCSSRA